MNQDHQDPNRLPGLAVDIAERALECCHNNIHGHALKAAFDAHRAEWAKRIVSPDNRAQVADLLHAEDDLRTQVAVAIGWVVPLSDVPALVEGAIRQIKANPALAKDLADSMTLIATQFNWANWIQKPDSASLYQFLQGREDVRRALARLLKFDPGPARAQEMAALLPRLASPQQQAVTALFGNFLPDWESFQRRDAEAEERFRQALRQDFPFRQQVARAVAYRSPEADFLASRVVEMLRYPSSSERKLLIDAISRKLPGQKDLLENLHAKEVSEKDWGHFHTELSRRFSADPDLPLAFWDATVPKDSQASERPSWPLPFSLVLRQEIREVEERRKATSAVEARSNAPLPGVMDAFDLAADAQLAGLAFSGGGIRSATFNLGVLQYLAEINLLQRFDYLSTVSGGGYIGSWLAAWSKRKGFEEVRKDLSPAQSPDPSQQDVKPIRFLRQYSNYLTPELGLFSFDTWTMAAVYTRNLTLNQTMLVMVLGFLLLLPRIIAYPLTRFPRNGVTEGTLMWIAIGTLLLSVASMAAFLRGATGRGCMDEKERESQLEKEKARAGAPGITRFGVKIAGYTLNGSDLVQLTCVLPVAISVISGSIWFWLNIHTGIDEFTMAWKWFWIGAFAVFTLLSLILSGFGGVLSCFQKRWTSRAKIHAWGLIILTAVVTGGCGMLLLRGYLVILRAFFDAEKSGGLWHATVFGPILLFAVLATTAIVHIGLLGIDFPDPGREWLSRFRAVTSLYAFFGLALFAVSIYGPLLVAWLAFHFVAGIPALLAWAGTTIASVLAGRSAKTGQSGEATPVSSALDFLAKLGPPVFLVGFLLLISEAEQLLLVHGLQPSVHSLYDLYQYHWQLIGAVTMQPGEGWWISSLLSLASVLFAGAVLLVWRVDINDFSMHHFYKNRLVRCYLGASNKRREPDAFTGFDDNDDVLLAKLTPSHGYRGPYPILNSTLNISAGDQLAWQERKAASFIFTPRFAGFDHNWDSDHTGPPPSNDNLKFCAYRRTEEYGGSRGGLHVGTVAAISGAAADPNMGYTTSTTVAFLLTVFDVRLAWWLGNPRRDRASQLASPRFGLVALFSELLGRTNDRSSFVNLSDGGHFDNMGIYELVRRRCRFIVLCDAEQDGEYKFAGLGTVIRRCRVDFGAEIRLDPSRIGRAEGSGWSQDHCAVGSVTYIDGTVGTLVYIKSSVTGDEPEDVIEYKASHPTFPHDSTANQWFGESQFESYRKLGYHAAKRTLQPGVDRSGWTPSEPIATLFEGMRQYWYPRNAALPANASRHTKTLNELLERVRVCPSLHVLGTQLFPDSGLTPQATASDVDEFYFSMALIQLMEDIYYDFQLDRLGATQDPQIGGWITLFHIWTHVPAVSAAWTAEKETFQKGFQAFWKQMSAGR